MSEIDPWQYRAAPDPSSIHDTGVVDGDTFDFVLDLGFATHHRERIRLLDIQTADIWGVPHDSDEYERGIEHRDFVVEWIEEAMNDEKVYGGWPLYVTSRKGEAIERESFRRWLGHVHRRTEDGVESLADALIEEFGDDVRY